MSNRGDNNNNATTPNPLNQYAYENNYGRLETNDPYNPANRVNFANFENVQPTPAPQQNFNPNQMPQQNFQQMPPMQPQMQPRMQPQMQPQMQQPVMAAPQPIQATAQAAPVKKKGHALEIVLIIFIFLIGIAAIVGAAYCHSKYKELSDQVNAKQSVLVQEAKEKQKILDDKAYEIRNASNEKEFTGPSDFGAITFKFPKTWNVYLDNNDDSNPTYKAYFSPEWVPPANANSIFALSFKIENQSYDNYIKKFDQRKLASTSAFSVHGLTGTKVMGKLDEKADQPNGAEVIIMVNNYVAIIRTDDYDKYGTEFDAIINELRSANVVESPTNNSETPTEE